MLQCLLSFTRHMRDGQLVWAPLCAWDRVQGDDLCLYKQLDGTPTYFMPKRSGMVMKEYPWAEHAENFLDWAKMCLEKLGMWTAPEEGVAGVKRAFALSNVDRLCLTQNKSIVQRTALKPTKFPKGFKLALMDDDTLSSVRLTHVRNADDLRCHIWRELQCLDAVAGRFLVLGMKIISWRGEEGGEGEGGAFSIRMIEEKGKGRKIDQTPGVWMGPRGLLRADPRV